MGILSFIISPLEDIVKGLTTSVEEIGKIFGVLIQTVEGIITLIEGLINDIKSLFDTASIEEIFLSPFKSVILIAIDSVEKIFDLIKDDIPTFGGFKELIITPFKDVYGVIADFTSSLETEIEKIVSEIKNYSGSIGSYVLSDLKNLVTEIESIPSEMVQFGERLKNNITVETKKLIKVVPEMAIKVASAPESLAKSITTDISADVKSYKDVITSLENKFKNENLVVDFFILVIFMAIAAFIGGIFYITRSFSILSGIFMAILVTALIVIIFEIIRNFK